MKSRVAVVGTLGQQHYRSSSYDLAKLREIVRKAGPDLLLTEIRPTDWRTGRLESAAPEYREALLPLARRTDIVIVPVAGTDTVDLLAPEGGRFMGLRTFLIGLLNAHLRWMQSGRRGLAALNSGGWGAVCDRLCSLTARLCGRETRRRWDEANRSLHENVLAATRRDPGTRVLVTVDCRRRHRLERNLRRESELDLVPYGRL